MEEDKEWCQMIASHGRAFAYTENKMGCVNPEIVLDMIIWTVPHMPWVMWLLRIT